MRHLPRWFLAGLLTSGLCAVAVAGGPDPLADAKDPRLATSDRVRAVEKVWSSDRPADKRREDLKGILWVQRNAPNVRVRCLELLYQDPSDADHADTRNMLRLMVATEGDFHVLESMCAVIERERWPDLAGPLVRSWSRSVLSRPDAERCERKALAAIAGSRAVEDLVFEVFITPAEGVGPALDRAEKARAAAWELLGRLDPDGARRRALLNAEPQAAKPDALLDALRSCARDLRCIPLTGSQLDWAKRLREDTAAGKHWWTQATQALAALPPDRADGLRLRHAEPVRWASHHRPAWCRATREELLETLRQRLNGRRMHSRTDGDSAAAIVSERLADQHDKLSWGDALTILVIDEAIQAPHMAPTLWEQAVRDSKDTSTEYGGLLEAADSAGPAAGERSDAFRVTLYPPRATSRRGDKQFVASDDMLAAGPRALAHYHFHAQRFDNGDYAGPGPGDMDYAQDQGRACLVLTPIREGRLNVDYYQAGSVRIDLGTIVAPGY